MDISEILQKRLQELVTITKTIGVEASDYKFQNEKLISEIKSSGDSPSDLESNRVRVREMRKISTLSFMKSNEIQINIRVMNELYAIMKYAGVEVKNLDEKDLEILDFNINNVKPVFIMDKGSVVFFDKELEEIMMTKLQEASPGEDDQIKKVKNFKIDGKN